MIKEAAISQEFVSSSESKVALVTGSSRGIGRAIALALAAAGLDVAFHYQQSAEEVQTAVAQAPIRAETICRETMQESIELWQAIRVQK